MEPDARINRLDNGKTTCLVASASIPRVCTCPQTEVGIELTGTKLIECLIKVVQLYETILDLSLKATRVSLPLLLNKSGALLRYKKVRSMQIQGSSAMVFLS